MHWANLRSHEELVYMKSHSVENSLGDSQQVKHKIARSSEILLSGNLPPKNQEQVFKQILENKRS